MRLVPVPGTGTLARRRSSPRQLVDTCSAEECSARPGALAKNAVGYSRFALGRIAQRESARFTRGRSLVRSQVRPSSASLSGNPESVRPHRLGPSSRVAVREARLSVLRRFPELRDPLPLTAARPPLASQFVEVSESIRNLWIERRADLPEQSHREAFARTDIFRSAKKSRNRADERDSVCVEQRRLDETDLVL